MLMSLPLYGAYYIKKITPTAKPHRFATWPTASGDMHKQAFYNGFAGSVPDGWRTAYRRKYTAPVVTL